MLGARAERVFVDFFVCASHTKKSRGRARGENGRGRCARAWDASGRIAGTGNAECTITRITASLFVSPPAPAGDP